MKTNKPKEQLIKIKVPTGIFCSDGDCPYYTERGVKCAKLGDTVPFELSEYCINFNGKKYKDCPIYKR